MPNPYSGLPSNVQTNLPGTLAIASTTFTTPIVATTTGAHGLGPGDHFAVYGATDPSANGLFVAGTCTATTVVLLQLPSGTNSVGTLAGGVVGTLAPAGYGVTVPLLSDNDKPMAAAWNVPYEALCDRVAWLLFLTSYRQIIKAGGTLFIQALGSINAAVGSTMAGVWDFVPGGTVRIRGQRARGVRVPLSAANHTVLVTDGNRFLLADNPGNKTITLKSTGTVPVANETLDFICNDLLTAGTQWTFIREDTTVICTFTASAVAAVNRCWAEFEFASGAWHLGASSGSAYDGAADYGVLPGTGV